MSASDELLDALGTVVDAFDRLGPVPGSTSTHSRRTQGPADAPGGPLCYPERSSDTEAGVGEDRYSQDEVAAILKRSAEIEGEKLKRAPAAELSLSDLEQIAEESGLDPASVRAAARELARAASVPATGVRSKPLGGARLHHQRSLEGELKDAGLEQLVESAGPQLNLTGRTTRAGGGWQWTERWGHRRLRVRASSRHGHTNIELDEDLRPLRRKLAGGIMTALGSFGFAFGFAFGLNVESSMEGAILMAALGTSAALATGFGISRLLFRQLRMTRDVQLQRLVTALDREGREALSTAKGDEDSIPGERVRETDRADDCRERRGDRDEDDGRRHRGRKGSRSRH